MPYPGFLTTFTRNMIVVWCPTFGDQHLEDIADGALKPGMLVKKTADGMIAHPTAGGDLDLPVIVVKENGYYYPTNVDTVYADEERVFLHKARSGDILLMRFKTGETSTKGMQLISDGAGSLKATTGSPTRNIATALEVITTAVDNPLILVRIN